MKIYNMVHIGIETYMTITINGDISIKSHSKGPLHNYVTPKMTVFYPPTHPVTLGNVSIDPPTPPPQRYVIIEYKE